jgi:hypothetical protein
MSRGLATGEVVRSRTAAAGRCLALSGKGAPGPEVMLEAIAAVTEAAAALRAPRLRGAHVFQDSAAEWRLRAPLRGARGGPSWTVFVRVPRWVGVHEATAAIEEASRRMPLAKGIRLSPVEIEPFSPKAPPGRDRQPGQIRRRRNGPQHRARELH